MIIAFGIGAEKGWLDAILHELDSFTKKELLPAQNWRHIGYLGKIKAVFYPSPNE